MTARTPYRKLVDPHTVARLEGQHVLLSCDLHMGSLRRNHQPVAPASLR